MFQFNMFDEMETPIIILSTKYHKHLGKIKTIDPNTINQNFQMASHQEVSFDVYKELDGKKYDLWDRIVDFKYIYIPKHNIYYEITVSLDENDKTVKHITGKSACEAELSTRKISIECNTEQDIARDDYIPTVLYNEDNPNASLLDRVLHDKCPDYTIGHVDSSIAKLQRTFSCEDEDIYTFLTTTVAEELECLFIFDSATRTISVYDLKYWCNECGYRGEEAQSCPKCGNTHYITYGDNTGIYISSENYAESLTIEGESDNVFNCLRIEGGDELMTATLANINQNGSNYIYNYSKLMQEDMPEELVQKIYDYQELYNSYSDEYADYTEIIYTAIEDEMYLTSEMMPDIVIPETTAIKELQNLENNLIEVSVQNITTISLTSSDLAVKGMAKVIVDPRYKVEVIESSISDLQSGNTKKTWTGKFVITNNGNEEDTATSENYISVKLVGNNYEEYLYQQIQKKLGNEDSAFNSIFDITDDTIFKSELKKYCLDRLKSFESSYQTCLEVLIENGVTNENNTFYDVDLYNTIYVPYYNRILYIQAELVLREQDIEVIQKKRQTYELMRSEIQNALDFKNYIGEELWIILSHYLKEDVYKNDNYISEGLTTSELLDKAKELYEVGKKEIIKASTLQMQLSSTLNNLLNTKEFAPFKDKIKMGNWINVKVDDIVYKNRLISIKPDYGNKDKIGVLFSNVSRVKDEVSDVKSILSQAQSMSKSYGTVSHQASQGEDAKTTIQEYRNVGLNTALYNIVNSNTQDVKFDEHGLSCRKFDDVIDDYSPEQLRIINNTLAFTKDNWKSVSAALGKLKYRLNGKVYEDYGLNADHVVAGKVISGDIYSANYETDERGKLTKGTHFDLESGDFALADGRIVYDATNQKMIVRNVDLDWKTSNIEDLGAIKSSVDYYGLSDSSEIPPTEWNLETPTWTEGMYIWVKTKYTYVDDTTSESQPVCIQGAKGQDGVDGKDGIDGKNGLDGADAISSVITSSQGEMFNSSSIPETTILTCHVYKGGQEIEPTSYLWQELSDNESEWVDIGTEKSITITLNSFQVKNRIKCNYEI